MCSIHYVVSLREQRTNMRAVPAGQTTPTFQPLNRSVWRLEPCRLFTLCFAALCRFFRIPGVDSETAA
jgi:hypothetical protein